MPEKPIQDIPRSLRDSYEKGLSALEKSNLDYALSIFEQVLVREPGFFECRQALRATQVKKHGTSTGLFKKMLGVASSSPQMAKGQMLLRSNPLEAIRLAEQVLNGDPNNNSAHRLLAEAALAAGLPRTAVMSLEFVMKSSPGDKAAAISLASAFREAGQDSKAEGMLAELQRLYPNDPAIAQSLKNVSASRTMDEGGYSALEGGQGSYRDILKNKDEAVKLEQEKRDVKTEDSAASLIQEYEQRLEREPTNLKLLRNIAEIHAQQKNFDKAIEFYNRILGMDGVKDPSIEKSVSDLAVKRIEHAISLLDPAAPDFEERSATLKKERQDLLISECKARVEKYPTDLQLRFELGVQCFNAGRVSEAIQEFQKAQNSPHKRIQAMGYLGQCFAKRGMNDLAARTLQNAIKEKQALDEEKKDLIYALGLVLEKMGKKEESIDQLKLIYEADIGYKDVAERVDAYYSSQ